MILSPFSLYEDCTDPDHEQDDLASFTFTLRPMIRRTITLPTAHTTTAIPTPRNLPLEVVPSDPELADSDRLHLSRLGTGGKSAGPEATRTFMRDGDGRAGGVEARDISADASVDVDGDRGGHGDEDGHDPERGRATRIRLCLWQLLRLYIGMVGSGPGIALGSDSESVLSAGGVPRVSTPTPTLVSALPLSAFWVGSPSDLNPNPDPNANPLSDLARPDPLDAGPSALSGSEARAQGSGASSPRLQPRPGSEVRSHDQGQAQSADGAQSSPPDQSHSQSQPSLPQTSVTNVTNTSTMDMEMADTNTNTTTVTNMNTDTNSEINDTITNTNNTNTDENMKDTNMPDTNIPVTNIPYLNMKNTHTNTDAGTNTSSGRDTTQKLDTAALDRTVEPIDTTTPTAPIGRTSATVPIMTSASKSCRIPAMILVSEFCALIISHYRARQPDRSRQPQKESDVQSRNTREGSALFSLDELKSSEKGQRETGTSGPTDTARQEEGGHREGVVVDPSLEVEGRGLRVGPDGSGGVDLLNGRSDRNPGRGTEMPLRTDITSTRTGGRVGPYNYGTTSAISGEEVPVKRPAPNSSEVGDADGLAGRNKRRRLEPGPSILDLSASARWVGHSDGASRARATRDHGETDERIGDQHRENVDDDDHDDKGGMEKWVARCQNIGRYRTAYVPVTNFLAG
jgi:hypothetical protein